MISPHAYGNETVLRTHVDSAPETHSLTIGLNRGSESHVDAPDQQADSILARYFGDLRRHALLSRDEEQALWNEIEQRKERLRRTLYMSPFALATLTRMWHQVQAGDLLPADVMSDDEKADLSVSDLEAKLESAVLSLETQHNAIERLRSERRTAAAAERRAWREPWRRLWQQWLETWEALHGHSSLHEAIAYALEAAFKTQPQSPSVRAAYAAWSQARRQLKQAEERMLKANLRLVIHVANRYRGRGVPLLDLIQEGNIGLMRALEKFEPRRGLKLVTYAHWWVRQAISRSLMEQYRTVRLPVYVAERKHKLQSVTERFSEANGREPSVEELSEAIGWTPEEVVDTQLLAQPIARLHTPIASDGCMLADVLEDTATRQLEERHAEQELHTILTDCLDSLTEREAFVLRLRYGLDADRPSTLQEIANRLGLGRERVRQLEKKALEKLRQSSSCQLLADFAN